MEYSRGSICKSLVHDGIRLIDISLFYPVFRTPALDVFEKAAKALAEYAEKKLFFDMCSRYDKSKDRRKRLHQKTERITSSFSVFSDERYVSVLLNFSICGRAAGTAMTFDTLDGLFVSCGELGFGGKKGAEMFFYRNYGAEENFVTAFARGGKKERIMKSGSEKERQRGKKTTPERKNSARKAERKKV